MKFQSTGETIKFAAGSLVVVGAVLIMMPGLLGYVASLWRLLVLAAVVMVSAWVVAAMVRRLSPGKDLSPDSDAQVERSNKLAD